MFSGTSLSCLKSISNQSIWHRHWLAGGGGRGGEADWDWVQRTGEGPPTPGTTTPSPSLQAVQVFSQPPPVARFTKKDHSPWLQV